MTIFTSRTVGQKVRTPSQAGTVMKAVFTHTFTKPFDASEDILEIGVLPAYAQVVGAELLSTAFGALTADVGFMDGDVGDDSGARTLAGTELWAAQSINDTADAITTKEALAIAPAEKHRGIGVEVSGDITASASKTLTLVLEYVY